MKNHFNGSSRILYYNKALQQSTAQICIHHLNLNNHGSPPSPRSEATFFATNINENLPLSIFRG
jgi:hypothetical protein